MSGFLFSSLRFRLSLLVLLAVIPALGLILYTASEQRKSATVAVEEDALRLARIASSEQERIIEGARQLLISLAQLPEARENEAEACNTLFTKLREQFPFYANLGAFKPTGDVFCSGTPVVRPVNASDHSWFQRTVESLDFAIGDYQIGRITGIPVLVHGYPVLDDSGRLEAVVFAALDLAWLNQLAAEARLPEGSTLTVIDVGGTVLARYPEPETWVGKSVRGEPITKAITTDQDEYTVEAVGLDNVSRLFGITRLRGAPQSADVYLSVGIPKAAAVAETNRVLKRNLTGLAIVTVLTLMAAWLGGHLFILRPIRDLVSATRRLAAGELGARSGLPPGQGEIGQLARGFDDMAAALEARQAELEKTEAERSANEGLLSDVLDIADDAIITLDEGQNILRYNLGAEKIFGYRAEEVLGRPLDLLLPQRFVQAHRHHIEAFGASPETARHMGELAREVFGRRKDGNEFPADASISKSSQGTRTIFTVILRDVTDRTRIEDELRNNEQHVRNILNSLFILVGLLTPEGILIEANRIALDVASLKPEDVLGKPFEEAYWWSYSDEIKQQLRESIERTARGETVRYDVVVRVGENRFITIDFGLQPLFDEAGRITGLVPSATDITDRVKAEQELRKYRDHLEEVVGERTAELAVALEQAQESDQLKSQLLSTVSHELRTPLTAIKGFSTALLDHQDQIGPRERSQFLQEIDRASDRLTGLIGNLLQLSSLEAGMLSINPVPTGVQEIIEQATRQFGIRAPEKPVFVDMPIDVPLVHADPDRLREVVDNLLDNALKYTPAESSIWIKGSEDNDEGSPSVRISVSDDGPGLSPDQLARIFEPFHQTDEQTSRRVGGIGLGLTICRRIIEAQQGHIWAESTPGEGVAFVVALPQAKGQEMRTDGKP